MLTLYHNGGEIPLDVTEYYIRELASGMDEVIFDLSVWDPNYALIQEQDNIVDRGGQRYLVKQIDAGAVTAKIVCQLDLDEWRATLSVGYDSGTKTVAQQIEAVKPAGWSVVDRTSSIIGRTIKGDLTPLEVCEECRNTYLVYIRWDTANKRCTIYPQAMGTAVGSFATRELNLKEINYKGKSNNFATRLYAYGKDGLSFADINSGKPYVDNNTYSSRVICAYWQDDRYTSKTSLLQDATEKLAKLAVPERSYDCAIVDLQATNPALYNNLDFSLFTTATLIDDIKGTAIDYQVVERHVWPYHPDRNDVIFNSSPIKIQNAVIQIEDEITNPNSTFQQIQQARIDEATNWLLDGDGYVVAVKGPDDEWKELLFMDTNDIATAQKVLRINENGIGFSSTGAQGPYTNAWTIDGQLVADFITTGTMTAERIRGGILQSSDSLVDPNFILNLATGAITAKKLSIDSTNLQVTEQGVITATGATINGSIESTHDYGHYTQGTRIESGEIYFDYNGTATAEMAADSGGVSIRSSGTHDALLSLAADSMALLSLSGVGGIEIRESNNEVMVDSSGSVWIRATDDVQIESQTDNVRIQADDTLALCCSDLSMNGTTGWTGTLDVTDSYGNPYYADVENGIITGWHS